MKKLINLALIFSSIMIFSQKVTINYEESTDFSDYKSYQFLGWQEKGETVLNESDKQNLRNAIQEEMRTRGYVMLDSGADMAISLFVVIDKKTSTSSYSNHYDGAGYGYGRAPGGTTWGNGHANTSYTEKDYLEGTLVFDMLDSKSKELIWQSVATGTVNENSKKREKSIPKAVKKMMKKFPDAAKK